MSMEELVRAEFRSVAEQVPVPAMPVLEEPRRTWQVAVAAAAAAAVVIGGLTFLLHDEAADRDPRPIETPQRVQIDRTAPTIPWIDEDRLYVGGEQLPGRWMEVVSAGDTWMARRRDLHVFWGRGSERHDLGRAGEIYGEQYAYPLRGHGPFLSPNGRYLANTDDGAVDSTFELLDTHTGRSREVRVEFREGANGVTGVTDDGLVVTGAGLLEPGKAPRPLDRQGGRLTGNGDEGFVLSVGHSPDERRWAVVIEGTGLRRVAEVTSASLSHDRRWLLDLAWAEDQDEPADLPVTDLTTGDAAPTAAPKGWVFAPLAAPGYWEPAGTLVATVVDPESREYRTARCAPSLGRCVLLEQS